MEENSTKLSAEQISEVTGGKYIGPCFTYTVVKGDTLGKLAKKYHTDVDTLVELNHIKNKNLIRIGQILLIPQLVK